MAKALHEPELILARAEDRSFFVTCHHNAYRATVEQMFEWNAKTQDALVSKKFDLPGIHLINVNGERVGVIGVHMDGPALWLRDFFVLPQYQNQGIGDRVVRQVQHQAAQASTDLRVRTSRVNHRAKCFYERHGFVVLEQSDLHLHMIWGSS